MHNVLNLYDPSLNSRIPPGGFCEQRPPIAVAKLFTDSPTRLEE